MKKQLLIFALSLITYLAQSQVVPNIDWVKTFNPRFQRANAPSALDANNNVYVTGYISTSPSNQDLIVLKYDSLGTLLWSYIYNNGGNDAGKAIKVSSTGNVYVTGQSYDAASNFDYYTIKLSPTGSVIWSARYDYFSSTDAAVDIKIDELAAKVYVTGSGFNGSDNDIITLLYDDSNGSLVWNNVFDGGVSGNDDAVGLVIVDNGNFLMIAGNCINSSGNYDIAAINIKNDGGPNWSYYTDGTAGTNDNAKAIIATGANVAICGMLDNNTTGKDYTTIVIDALSPTLIWQNNYDVSNGVQSATSLVNDSTGNIAVTGYAVNSGIYEYHTLLYTPAGTQIFTNIESTGINNLYIEPRVATDTIAHHFYVSGAKLNTNNDVFVYQIAPSGNTKWREYHNGSSNLGDAATGLVVNGIGVVYLSALSLNTSGNWDIITMKISQTPVYFPVNYNLVPDTFSFSNLFYLNSGEILDTTLNSSSDVLLYTKFTYPNQYILKDRISFCEYKKTEINNQIFDTLSRVDMIFVGGNKMTKHYPLNTQTLSTLNYFTTGAGQNGRTDIKGASHIIVPNIYPNIDLWYSSNSFGSKYYFVVKPGGNPAQIMLSFQGSNSTSIVSNDLKITSALGSWLFKKPEIYSVMLNPFTSSIITSTVSGVNGWNNISSNLYSVNTGTYNNAFPLVISFNMGQILSTVTNSLNCEWSTYVGGANDDEPFDVKSNSSNELFVVGRTASNNFPLVTGVSVFQNVKGGSNDGYIDKYDANGVKLWSTFVGGSNDDVIKSIDFASNGDLYIVGQSNSNLLTFSKAGATNSLSPIGDFDGFILQTNSTSNQKKWLTYIGGSLKDEPHKCKFDNSGNFYVVGWTASTNIPTIGVSPQYLQSSSTPSSTTDGFIIKYNPASQTVWRTYLGASNDPASAALTDGIRDLDFDSSNELVVVGFSSGSNFPNIVNGNSTNYALVGTKPDATVTRFSSSGQIKYSSFFGGNGYDYYTSVKCKNNKVYLTGVRDVVGAGFPLKNSGNWYYFTGTSGLSDCVYAVMDNKDSLLHLTYLQGNSNTLGLDLEIDNANKVYISGLTRSSILPSSVIQPSLTYVENFKGQSDYFIYALEENNTNLIWATNVGGTNDEGFNFGKLSGYIDINSQNNLHIVGTTYSNAQFPLFNGSGVPYFDATQNGNSDASITRFKLVPINGLTEIKEENVTKNKILVYPNPTNKFLNFSLDKIDNHMFEVYNTLGQIIISGKIINNENSVDVSGLKQGLYFLNIYSKNQSVTTKFIKID